MNIEIKPFKCYLKKEFLFDMDPNYIGQFDRCSIIGISAYLNETLTFTVITSENGLFANLPIHAFKYTLEYTSDPLELSDLAFINCPSERIELICFERLKNIEISCFFAKKNIWKSGEYLLSVDFSESNEMVNLVLLENSQLAWVPNHKINWSSTKELPKYKKQKSQWTI